MIGTDGRFRQVNAALCDLTGRSEEQLLRLTLADTIHPEEWAARKRLFERMLTGEIRTHQTQGRLLADGGEPRWVLVNATALTDAEGWPAEFFVQFQDITEQTRGQQLLRARHDVTRVLAQAATVEQAAPLLLEALGGNLGWEVGTLWLADDESGELQPAATWRHRSFEAELPRAGRRAARARGPAGARDPLRRPGVDRGADGGRRLRPRDRDRRRGALRRRLPADPHRRGLPRRDRVLLPRARRARRAAARAAGHHRAADRPLHPAHQDRARARRRARRGARGDRHEVAVPRQHEPRAAHPDERRDRDGRAAARHEADRGAAGLRLDGALLGRRPADDHQRHPRPVEDRGRQGRARARRVQPLRRGRRRRRAAGRERPRQGPRAARVRRAPRAAAGRRRPLPPPAGAHQPRLQRGQVHRARARSPSASPRASRPSAAAASASTSPTPGSASTPRRPTGCSSRSRRPTRQPPAPTAAPASG